MQINVNGKPLDGFQSTDGGFVYRRVTPTEIVTSDNSVVKRSGLLTLEQRATTDKSGETRLLIRVKLPYHSVSETKCCGSDTMSTDVVPAGYIVSHLVLTLSKKVVKDLQGSCAQYAANQIAAALGLNLGTSNLVTNAMDNLCTVVGDVIHIDKEDTMDMLNPKFGLTRSILGVTPIPPEGIDATTQLHPISVIG